MVLGARGSLLQGPGPLLSQQSEEQSEVQRLKKENELLVARFQNAKAMGDRYYYNWMGIFPQLKNLKTENEELRKKLEDTRRAIGVLEDENDNLKTKLSIPRKRALSKAIFGVPTVTAVSCTNPNINGCLTCRLENFQFRHARKEHKLA